MRQSEIPVDVLVARDGDHYESRISNNAIAPNSRKFLATDEENPGATAALSLSSESVATSSYRSHLFRYRDVLGKWVWDMCAPFFNIVGD